MDNYLWHRGAIFHSLYNSSVASYITGTCSYYARSDGSNPERECVHYVEGCFQPRYRPNNVQGYPTAFANPRSFPLLPVYSHLKSKYEYPLHLLQKMDSHNPIMIQNKIRNERVHGSLWEENYEHTHLREGRQVRFSCEENPEAVFDNPCLKVNLYRNQL